jgi:hypothetical protein
VLLHERRRGIERRVADRAAVGVDRLGPQLRHACSIHSDVAATLRLDRDIVSL